MLKCLGFDILMSYLNGEDTVYKHEELLISECTILAAVNYLWMCGVSVVQDICTLNVGVVATNIRVSFDRCLRETRWVLEDKETLYQALDLMERFGVDITTALLVLRGQGIVTLDSGYEGCVEYAESIGRGKQTRDIAVNSGNGK